MKKIISLLIFMIIIGCSMTVYAEDLPINVIVDGEKVEFTDIKPLIRDGRVLVPIRFMSEKMGALVEWDETHNIVKFQKKQTKPLAHVRSDGVPTTELPADVTHNISIQVDDNMILDVVVYPKTTKTEYNGNIITTSALMDTVPIIVENRVMLPARCVATLLGYTVNWDANTRTVICTQSDAVNTEFNIENPLGDIYKQRFQEEEIQSDKYEDFSLYFTETPTYKVRDMVRKSLTSYNCDQMTFYYMSYKIHYYTYYYYNLEDLAEQMQQNGQTFEL